MTDETNTQRRATERHIVEILRDALGEDDTRHIYEKWRLEIDRLMILTDVPGREEVERWRVQSIENWQAFSAMRDAVNEVIGDMPSSESSLLKGPESRHDFETFALAVRDAFARKEANFEATLKRARTAEERLREVTEINRSLRVELASKPLRGRYPKKRRKD